MRRDYLDEIERQLVAATERGARPRTRRPRREWLALVPAIAAAAAIVTIVVTSVSGSGVPRRVPSHPASHVHPITLPLNGVRPRKVTIGRVPAGFGPESFTAIGETQWWLLGSAPCSSPPCTAIARTSNGGASFVGIPAPRTAQVTQLRFADASDGYAFDSQLWTTHNGGRNWKQVNLGGNVSSLATSGGYAFAIVRSNTGSGRLMRSPIGRDAWTALSGAGDAFTGLWVQGADVLLESATSSANELAISHDSGNTFAVHPAPPSVACRFEEQQPSVVWEPCATGMMSGIWRSTDGGATFKPAGGDASNSGPQLPNSAAFASASASTAVVGYRQLYRTTDGGASYRKVPTPAGITWWQYLGFTDPTHGVALGYVGTEKPSDERLYYTTDGGQSYHLVRVGS